MTPSEYQDRVLAGLRRLTPEEREAVRRELDGHIEDHMEALRELGYDEALAQERTMAAMGDPEEVGRELEKQYPLRWLILGRLAVVATVVLCIQMMLGVGLLGMVWDSLAARIYPSERTDLNTVVAQEWVDIRIPVGNDVLRIYRVAVGHSGDELGVWEAENPRGETKGAGGGRGSWWVEYTAKSAVLEPGDPYVTVTYDYLGQHVSVELPLPEGAWS